MSIYIRMTCFLKIIMHTSVARERRLQFPDTFLSQIPGMENNVVVVVVVEDYMARVGFS